MKEFIEKLIERLGEEVEYQHKKADGDDRTKRVSLKTARNKMGECYNHAISIVNQLAEEYKDAEEQGLLLRLPCKVGDTVYEISLVEPYRNPAIREMGVVDILLRDNDMYFTLQDLHDEYYDNSILSTEFGKTVFLTEAEAEQALNQMGE